MSLACLAHVNFLLHMYFDLITEQINDDDDDDDDDDSQKVDSQSVMLKLLEIPL